MHALSYGFFWKVLERFSVQGTQFVIQIILARILSPENYGALAIMLVFINIANVVIQNGFNTSLIQKKNADEVEYSSVFWLLLVLSILVYLLLFFSAPYISNYYKMPYLEEPFKIICLILIPGALNSVQLAIIRRKLDFKKEFISNFASVVIAGIGGIVLAVLGYGLWALVVHSLLKTTIACFTMWKVVKWKPTFVLNVASLKELFNFGYKLVLASLLEAFSNNLSSIVIGAKYNASVLGFFSRGAQFPNAVMGAINTTVQSVMLPVLSMLQDDKEKARILMRKSIIVSCYLVFPMMAGFAGIAKPLVILLLTEKWLDCVPYMQMFCFIYAFWPIHSCNLQAINAMGRSDVFLRLEIIKKVIMWINLIIAVFVFNSPLAIAATGMVSTVLCSFVNCYPNKYLLKYSFQEQWKDVVPYFALSIGMFYVLDSVSSLLRVCLLNLFLLIAIGIVFYLFFSVVFRLEAFCFLWNRIKPKVMG